LIGELIPAEWLAPAATGTPQQCVEAIDHQFAIGADRVILHGASPTDLSPIVAEYRVQHGSVP
jgi:alkanesulfonate monooxygenase SsuD/methylene tetrahydromethanopterin reductase-like flavin-dependent oxidoreductase (luciferase family)